MTDKKVIIFMQSYGSMNTKQLLDNSTKNFRNIEIVALPNENKTDVSSYDFVGFASGIYFWDFGKEIYKHIEKLKGLEGKNVFTICTAGSPYESHPKKPKESIEKKGGKLVAGFGTMGSTKGGITGFIRGVFNMQVRPNDNDYKECQKFIENTLKGEFNFTVLG